MANPIIKAWKYFMASLGAKVDEHADPKVQIEQAIDDAKNQHRALVEQAANVIGNQRQLELKLSRQMTQVEKLQSSARQALVLADKARAEGNEQQATQYESTATAFATQLVAAEQSLEDLKTLHDQALSAAQQAKQAVDSNAMLLQQRLAERAQLLNQLEQAKMQERVADSLQGMSQLTASGNVPSLDEVREKIESRYATAMGRSELAQNSVEGRMLEVQKSALDMAGASRLEQIRASMAGGQLGQGQKAPAVGPAAAATPPAAATNGSLPLAEQRLKELRDADAASGPRPPA
ncbi:PspA/IM30 family protein [Cryptosporangium phraense]|uniref:PspA/IM30 family protein n=1 Tax=Cryptosporangium phraense TaxID=2593070 RepID=A0A545AU15_9ACTN|nr:PspA/IM30 family protein [Cryptosporangium phraense]TQS44826.1 PspA/IM30 family protein [Cryptosporangium phraense]